MNSSETTLKDVRAVIEVRSEDTHDGDVVWLAYLVLFNERETPLRVVVGNKEGTIGAGGGFTEILVSYYTSKETWRLPYVDTDIGRVTWDIDTVPPKVQIDLKHTLI